MGLLKEKLESLNYSQVYILWDLWIQQNAESPFIKQMIEELSDMAGCDSISETELLSDIADIDNLCKPKSESEPKLKTENPQYYVSECPDTKRQFLVQTGKDGNIIELTSDNIHGMKLLEFLKEQHIEYQENILSFYAVNEDMADDAKNEFLESLWDVIQQHFDDLK